MKSEEVCKAIGGAPRESQRPGAARMKDSDDYITARAANPRTGMISPSVGTRTPCTPDSPGAALKMRSRAQHSPSPDPAGKAARCEANEGRKINSGAGSPRQELKTKIEQTSDIPASCTCGRRDIAVELSDDQFVVHMPSSREPQPFAYPGYTAEQIEASEHYRQKARRVSSEGYDQRLCYSASPKSTMLDDDRGSESVNILYELCPGIPGQPQFRAYRHQRRRALAESPTITVRKRKDVMIGENKIDNIEPRRLVDRIDAKAALLLAPPISSGTSRVKRPLGIGSEIPGVVPRRKARRETGLISASTTSLAPSHMTVANSAIADAKADQNYDSDERLPSLPPVYGAVGSDVADLSRLPRVQLVHPNLAAVPQVSHPPQQRADGTWKCSLRCPQEAETGECLGERKTSNATVIVRRFSCSRPSDTQSGDAGDVVIPRCIDAREARSNKNPFVAGWTCTCHLHYLGNAVEARRSDYASVRSLALAIDGATPDITLDSWLRITSDPIFQCLTCSDSLLPYGAADGEIPGYHDC